jgi:hypothetical protein
MASAGIECGICHNMITNTEEDDTYECTFCDAIICCECYDSDIGCFHPGDAWCEKCRSNIKGCEKCDRYISSLMKENTAPQCDEHPQYHFI